MFFDLQNSSRTKFYKKFILKNIDWSSTETSLEPGQKKSDFDKDPVLDRMEIQLKKSGVQTEFVKNIDLDWAISDISRLKKQYANNEYILLFPFCSKKLPQKKWPFFKDLISRLKQYYKNKYPEKENFPRPDYWGGFIVKYSKIEFWEDMPHRIHKREVFEFKDNDWVSYTLSP